MNKTGLTGNQLKLIALIAMTIDHIGLVMFPQHTIFRIIGRLALPIYAFMIAEGCVHTRNIGRYLGTLAAVAALCQIVYFIVLSSLYQCILVTFSISVVIIILLKRAINKKRILSWAIAVFGIVLAFFITEILPKLLPNTDFSVDYGFLGVMLPVMFYLGKGKIQKLCLGAAILLALPLSLNHIQIWTLLSLPLLSLYNGQVGKWKMKYFFYIYYPVHLAIIYGIGFLV